ncbi:MAG TPA: diacylglycerol kinase family protein [Thermoleophilaceae bacterium]|nr:diacylglycerol kinase family protein [Thermoleophilaceae bacterium]
MAAPHAPTSTARAPEARAEELASRLTAAIAERKRMLVIVNPYATTVSDRLRNLVVYALQSRYDVEAVDTERRDHATQICREAAGEGYDVVVAFGGDGTVNEAANGLIGSDTPLSCLPGGATNVFHRTLGIPGDVVDATEHLLGMADDFRPRKVDLGLVNGRAFVFSSGVGLDASVVERVDAHPRLKARLGEYYYTWAAISTFNKRYLVRPPRMRVTVDGHTLDAVTVVAQNSDPFTYFGPRPIRVCEGAGLDTGSLGVAALRKATVLELPTLIPRLFSGRAATVSKHRQIEPFRGVQEALIESADGRPLPVQVDGDYIGEQQSVRYSAAPAALAVVS